MLTHERVHSPMIFLSTDIVQAGQDMIEEIGKLKGIHLCQPGFSPWHFDDLRRAIKSANDALANYDNPTAEQFNKWFGKDWPRVYLGKPLEIHAPLTSGKQE